MDTEPSRRTVTHPRLAVKSGADVLESMRHGQRIQTWNVTYGKSRIASFAYWPDAVRWAVAQGRAMNKVMP